MSISRSQFFIPQQLLSCRVVRDTNLTGTYFNGPSNNGVGATLSASTPGVLTIDGITVEAGNRILLVAQTSDFQNGIYVAQNASANWILQRSDDFQSVEQLKGGQYLTISDGATFKGAVYVLVAPLPAFIGIDTIDFRSSTSNGTLGTAAFKDASSNGVNIVASVLPGTTTHHFATFADVNGTIEDTGFEMTDSNEPLVASVKGSITTGNVAVYADNVGTIEDTALLSADIQLRTNIHAGRTTNIGGVGAGPILVNVPGMNNNSIVTAAIDTSANTVAVAKADATINGFEVTFTADPGATCLLNYTVFISAQ